MVAKEPLEREGQKGKTRITNREEWWLLRTTLLSYLQWLFLSNFFFFHFHFLFLGSNSFIVIIIIIIIVIIVIIKFSNMYDASQLEEILV